MNNFNLRDYIIIAVSSIVVICGLVYLNNPGFPKRTKKVVASKTNNINNEFIGTWCAEHRTLGVPMHETLVFKSDKSGYLEINTLSLKDGQNKTSKKNFNWRMHNPPKVIKVIFNDGEEIFEIENGILRSKSSAFGVSYKKE